MAAELDFSTGKAGIAITWDGATPWHGHGNRVPDDATLDEWRIAAGLNWFVEDRKVLYGIWKEDGHKGVKVYPNRKVLLRSDTQAPLSIVSDNYKIVQPEEVLEFYRELIESNGFKMETAGSLKDGRRIWALAKTGLETRLYGQDKIDGYVLLATSYDGTLATTAKLTSVRVVCNNTLEMASAETGGSEFKVTHDNEFNPEEAKGALGLTKEAWEKFENQATKMATRSVDLETALAFFTKVLGDDAIVVDDEGKAEYSPTFYKLFSAYERGPGAELRSAHHTVWGLVNAVTFYQDHMARGGPSGNRLNSAWFGTGAARKRKAYAEALELAA